MNKKTLRWINAVLSNDENSSDKELKSYFIAQGIKKAITKKAISYRQKFNDSFFELTEKDLI